ncbi:DNA polymerase III subunit delta' [Pseudooceanicola sp. CBS1P-1]|uniref:DNA polymerase III subunit delta n=1 Tax=Pseudooceanicola albus TaxID=2692189 RepID=A0A6L7G8A8_9RHOB|nr:MULTISPECIES: DNA polymerase III subunit delta' [Pseudooceanicola]MBT9382907.1 DNA polymerase III subunit delta' [Pseudooceanicola endophyticus]MXN20169.1 DNA polymerase III subunit delta' [Pseudooceanicola albus]
MSDAQPEPDRVEGAPHPRDTARLIGQQAAEAEFLEAFNTGRLHHGWMITGPRGSGKATLAWSIARFLLTTPAPEDGPSLFGEAPKPDSLHVNPDHPVVHRMAAGAEPGLFVLRRGLNEKTGKLKTQITVDEARRLKGFFTLSATDGGRRVVIVDATDEMNPSAANALLKLLEEPPARTTLLLVTHQPSGLLPTIRSRCRVLRLAPLSPQDLGEALEQAGVVTDAPDELAALAGGSVGAAVRLANLDGLALYGEWIRLLGTLPNLDRGRAMALSEAAATRGAEERRDLLVSLLDLALARMARAGATGQPPFPQAAPHEAEIFARLAPDPHRARHWAAQAQEIGQRLRHGLAVNLDPAALILDTIFKLQKAAGSA